MSGFLFQLNAPHRLFRLVPDPKLRAFELLGAEKQREWSQLAEAHGAFHIVSSADGSVRRLVSQEGDELEVPPRLMSPGQ